MSRRSGDGLPDFVILGAQKSASTLLQHHLAQHPDVEMVEPEVRLFEDPDYEHFSPGRLAAMFTGHPSRLRGIKRPDYLGRSEVPERIRRHLPEARLLAVLRNPVSRAVSAYFHYVRHGFAPLLPLDTAFLQLLEGRLLRSWPRTAEILEYGRYGEHLTRYVSLFGPDRLLVLSQESLVSDTEQALVDVHSFLELPHLPPTSSPVPVNQGVYSASRLRVLRMKNHCVFRYTPARDRRYRRPVRPWNWTANALITGIDRLALSHLDRSPRPALSPDLTERLWDYYAADRERLAAVLPRDFVSSWIVPASR